MNPLLLPLTQEEFREYVERNLPRTTRLADPALAGRDAKNWIHITYCTKLIDKNEPLRQVLKQLSDQQSCSEICRRLTSGQRFLWLLSVFDGEIKNGGIAQFFWNCPALIETIRDTLSEFRMPELRSAYDRAVGELLAKFPEWNELRQNFRQSAAWEDFQASYDLLSLGWFDDQYFLKHCWHRSVAAPDINQVVVLRLIDYVDSHIEEFITLSRSA